jgi:hypothetical protein
VLCYVGGMAYHLNSTQSHVIMEKEIQKRLDIVKSRMNDVLQSRKSAHCAILGHNQKLEPYLIGTGVILEVNSMLFIVSAAHVFDEKDSTTLYLFLDEQVLPVNGELYCTVKPNNNRIEDKIDVAVLRVDNNQEVQIRKLYKPVLIDEVDVNDIPSNKKYYAFIGHPENKTKLKHGTFKVKSEMFSYGSFVADSSTYKQLALLPDFHVVVDFDERKCIDENGNRYSFPDAHGMSGGGVWLVENLNYNSSESQINKLVGVGIEIHKSPKALVGTRIGAVIEMIKTKFDGCQNLPKTNFIINDV